MGKRTTNKTRDRDYWPTKDPDAVKPLLPHLESETKFNEPCAGQFDLASQLEDAGHVCISSTDIHPWENKVHFKNVFDIKNTQADKFITNPPWTWEILTKIITHLSNIAPTWLLLNADLMHNKRMAPHMKRCTKVVSVGRVSWMNNGKKGFENAAWYLFDANNTEQTKFYGRTQ